MTTWLTSQEAAGLTAAAIGGKALRLAWLESSGSEVPAWCVLPAGQTPDFSELHHWLNSRRQEGHTRFIVRSSAILEDGSENSYAGIYESYPNLCEDKSIAQAVRDCLDASHAPRVTAYHYRFESQDPGPSTLAVIVQVLIDAQASGVLFTANPTTGSRREFVISSLFGAGHGVVSGECACDESFVTIEPYTIRRQIAHKEDCFRLSEEGLVKTAIPESERDLAVLKDEDLCRLSQQGVQLTEAAGFPLDIEWVIDVSGKLHIVQARPITRLGPDLSSQADVVFDNSNIQESFSGLTRPLTFSYASEVYRLVYDQLLELMGFSDSEVQRQSRRHGKLLALVKGRVFYNINSWYEGLLLMPSFGRNKVDMEKMMGVEQPIDFIVDQKLSPLEKLKRLPGMSLLLLRLAWQFATLKRQVRGFRTRFDRRCHQFWSGSKAWVSAPQLFEDFVQLKTEILADWKAPIINDFYVMMKTGSVRRALEEVGLDGLLPDLMCGEDLESLNPTLRLMELAEMVRERTDLVTPLANQHSWNTTLKSEPAIAERWHRYIDQYGDRVAGELKLESVTYRENPEFLLAILRSYVRDPDLNSRTWKSRQLTLRKAAELKVFAAVRSTRKFRRHLAQMRRGIQQREAMRLDRTRSFGMVRAIFRELGRKLHDQGLLARPEDITYLTVQEVDDFLSGKAVFDAPQDLIELRRRQYLEWQKLELAGQLRMSLPIRDVPKPEAITSPSLQGLGCYPGEVEGEVVVMREPSAGEDLKGRILVAQRTDPGWTPLFAQIRGLIVERGSLLSHSAVIAREMGIPTVVGIPQITSLLQTGQRVHLDGKTGAVEIKTSRDKELQ